MNCGPDLESLDQSNSCCGWVTRHTSPFSTFGLYIALSSRNASSESAVRSARDGTLPLVVVVVVGAHVSASDDSESERAMPSRPVSRFSAMVVVSFLLERATGQVCDRPSVGFAVLVVSFFGGGG